MHSLVNIVLLGKVKQPLMFHSVATYLSHFLVAEVFKNISVIILMLLIILKVNKNKELVYSNSLIDKENVHLGSSLPKYKFLKNNDE